MLCVQLTKHLCPNHKQHGIANHKKYFSNEKIYVTGITKLKLMRKDEGGRRWGVIKPKVNRDFGII